MLLSQLKDTNMLAPVPFSINAILLASLLLLTIKLDSRQQHIFCYFSLFSCHPFGCFNQFRPVPRAWKWWEGEGWKWYSLDLRVIFRVFCLYISDHSPVIHELCIHLIQLACVSAEWSSVWAYGLEQTYDSLVCKSWIRMHAVFNCSMACLAFIHRAFYMAKV